MSNPKTIPRKCETPGEVHKQSFKCRYAALTGPTFHGLRLGKGFDAWPGWICIVFLHSDQIFSKQFLDIANYGKWSSACQRRSPDLMCQRWAAVLYLCFWVSEFLLLSRGRFRLAEKSRQTNKHDIIFWQLLSFCLNRPGCPPSCLGFLKWLVTKQHKKCW